MVERTMRSVLYDRLKAAREIVARDKYAIANGIDIQVGEDAFESGIDTQVRDVLGSSGDRRVQNWTNMLVDAVARKDASLLDLSAYALMCELAYLG